MNGRELLGYSFSNFQQKRVSLLWIFILYAWDFSMRILVLIAIGLLLYIIVGSILRKNKQSSLSSGSAEKMVSCDHCGLHIAQKEAISLDNKYYCSEAHRDAEKK